MDKRRSSRDDGFTLIELLVVMAIIGILSAIAFPSFASQARKGRVARMRTDIRNAATAEESYTDKGVGYAPAGAAGITALTGEGLKVSADDTLTVVDDAMTNAGGGYCLQIHSASLTAAEDLYLASSGPNAGIISDVACVAS
jgi:type IV pilus assembly protein PilE